MRIRLGSLQQSAVEIYVTDPAHEQTACAMIGGVLEVRDMAATIESVVEGANSADCDGDRELCDALSRLHLRLLRKAR